MKKKTIFFADLPELRQIAQAAVGDFFDLKFCSSLEEAEASLRSPGVVQHVSLIVCGPHFDGGRMHDLLRFVRANEETKPTPFLCVKLRKGNLTSGMLKSIKMSCEMLGAQGFLHLPEIVSRHGELAAVGIFRSTLRNFAEQLQLENESTARARVLPLDNLCAQ